jgi:acetylglutamate kinase
MDGGFLPVISPVGRFADGAGCNVNGDDAAAAIAAGLAADELVLVADVAGVLDADGARIATLDRDGARRAMAEGVARGGMIAKLEAALRALEHGVKHVRIAGVEGISDVGAGTVVSSDRVGAHHR